jgi:hypothetical protein
MHQVRIFIGKEDDTLRLAKDINEWLAYDDVKVVNIFGNMSPQTIQDRSESGRILGAEGGGRRYAPSDIMLVVVFEQAKK